MSKISFSVSARTARLIGQENFTNAEGAIIELVKNGYDADAKISLVIFDIPFPGFPESLSADEFDSLELSSPEISSLFIKEKKTFTLNPKISNKERKYAEEYFSDRNSIYLIDNGEGMNNETIAKHWMTIGTGNKETQATSGGGRIRTGAKGIGRFALDRLGSLTCLWTKQENQEDGFFWEMDWKQFEKPNSQLNEIKATLLTEKSLDLNQKVFSEINDFPFAKKLKNNTFNHGTIIQIRRLRDYWSSKEIKGIFKGLEALIPPKELKIPFKVFQGQKQNTTAFGEVDTAFFNDYDYKLHAKFNASTLQVEISITRNELDISTVESKFREIFTEVKEPYDLATLKQKEFNYKKLVNNIIKWPKKDDNTERLKDVGDFEFTFYYLKNTNSQKEDYPYKPFEPSERQSVLNRFGGIKIYRDSFRVRPYGDPDNDWLDLGRRTARSPAGAGQRIGDWRVGSNQVAGMINISRLKNEQIIDKSDRGSLVENSSFDLFKKIIIGVIHEFEYDRSRILNPFYLHNERQKKKLEEERIRAEAEKLAEELYNRRRSKEERNKSREDKGEENESDNTEKEEYRKIIEETIHHFKQNDEKDAEIAQVRNLASLGLIMSSFAHELRGIKNNTDEILKLDELYDKVASKESKLTRYYKDGKDIIELLKSDGEKINHWVDYSITAIKKDKRKRKKLILNEYFKTLKKDWKHPLIDRNIDLIISEYEAQYDFRAFEMDMNTIFSNLISNSIDSFNNSEEIIDRKITIEHEIMDDLISIVYSDNGVGLPDIFTDKDEIFLAFVTSKKDRDGVDIGTGLGMYLVKNVVLDNNGTIEILDSEIGFKLKITFPTRKN